MSIRTEKRLVRELLGRDDVARIAGRAAVRSSVLRVLFALTYDPDPRIRRRAVEATGPAAVAVAAVDPEPVRRFLRGLLWLMNDESGGLGWDAPEVLGVVASAVPAMGTEFGPLIAQFTTESPFEAGACTALARLATVRPELVEPARARLEVALEHHRPEVRRAAGAALTALAEGPGRPEGG